MAGTAGWSGFGVEQQQADNPVDSSSSMDYLSAGISGYALKRRLDQGDTVGAVVEGSRLLDTLTPQSEYTGSGSAFGKGVAGLNLARALGDGDSGDIAVSGLAFALETEAGRQAVDRLFASGGGGAAGSNVPYVAYLQAAVLALEGEYEAAAVLAVSAYAGAAASAAVAVQVGAMAGPIGVAVAIAVQLVLGKLLEEDDPRATLHFARAADGDLMTDTWGNELGKGLKAQLAGETGDGLLAYLRALESGYGDILEGGRIDAASLPVIALELSPGQAGPEWRFEGGRHMQGAVQLLGENPSAESISRAIRDTLLISHQRAAWAVGEGTLIDPLTGEPVTQVFTVPGGDRIGSQSVSQAVGSGVLAGGGNVGGYAGVSRLEDSAIRSRAAPVRPLPAQVLEDVQATWRVDRGLFAGAAGQLLALGIASGLTDLSALAADAVDTPGEITDPSADGPSADGLLDKDDSVQAWRDGFAASGQGADSPMVAGRGVLVGTAGEDDSRDAGEGEVSGQSGPDEMAAGWLRLTAGGAVAEGVFTEGASADDLPTDHSATDGESTEGAADRMAGDADGIRQLAAGQDGGQPGTPAAGASGDGEDDPAVAAVASRPTGHMAHPDTGSAPVPGAGTGPAGDPSVRHPGDAEIPVGHRAAMREDRVLVTDSERLLANEAPGSVFLGISGSRHGIVEMPALATGDEAAIAAGQKLAADKDLGSYQGDLHFVVEADYHGLAGFTYRIRTAAGAVVERQAVITVVSVNDAPEAHDDTGIEAIDGIEDQGLDLNRVLANDRDVDGDALRVVAVGQVDHGAVEATADGWIYRPDTNWHGETDVLYVVEDDFGARRVARATLTIRDDGNEAPIIRTGVMAAGLEDRPLIISEADLLARIRDPDGDAISLRGVHAVSGGHLERVVGIDGASYVFRPDADFHGEARLAVAAVDSNGSMARGELTVEVANVIDPLIATPLIIEPLRVTGATRLSAAGLLGRLAIDNPDGGEVRIVGARPIVGDDGAGGEAVVRADGSVEYTPPPGVSGGGGVEIRLSNGISRTTARIDLEISAAAEPVRDETAPPAASADALTAFDHPPSANTAAGLTASAASPLAGGAAVGPPGDSPETVIRAVAGIEPAEPAAGIEPTVLIEPTESAAGSEPAGPTIDTIPQLSDRDRKDAVFNLDEDEARTFALADLLDRPADAEGRVIDGDGDGLRLTAARLRDAAHGQVNITPAGELHFEPAADLTGDVIIDLDISDGTHTVSTTVTPHLWAVNDAPDPVDDHLSGVEDTPLIIDAAALRANDRDIDGAMTPLATARGAAPVEADPLRTLGVWAVSSGTARYDATADRIRYTPAADHHGVAWIDTIVADGDGAWSLSRVHIDLASRPDPVRAVDDRIAVDEDTPITIPLANLTGNDHHPDGGPLRLLAVSAVTAADTLSPDAAGTLEQIDATILRYTPAENVSGRTTFDYTVADEQGHTSRARVTLDIAAINDAPQLMPLYRSGVEDTPITLELADLRAGARDVEGDWVQIDALTSDHGTLSHLPGSDAVVFTPQADLNSDRHGGPVSVRYRVVDEGGAPAEGIIRIDLAAVDDAPLAHDDQRLAWAAGPGGHGNIMNAAGLIANDREPDGEPLQLIRVSAPAQAGASVSLDIARQQLIYRAAADAIDSGQRSDRFSYTVSDGHSEATATVQVQLVDNHPPVLHDLATVTAEDVSRVFDAADILAHVDDPDRGGLLPETVTLVEAGDAINGRVQLIDGQVVFTPDADYNSVQGSAAGAVAGFDLTIEDIVGHRARAHVSIPVTPVNDAPIAVGEHLGHVDEDSAGLIFTGTQLIANDLDIDGDPIRLVAVTDAHGGQVTALGDDTWRFTPAAEFNGMARIGYRIDDGSGDDHSSAMGEATLTIRPVNDRPLVEYDRASGYDGDTYNTTSGLLDNDRDADGDRLSITAITGTTGPIQVRDINGGRIAWTASGPGAGSIHYLVSDGHGGQSESRLDLTILHKPVPPTFVGYKQDSHEGDHHAMVHTSHGGSIRITVAGNVNAWDPDGPAAELYYRGGDDISMTDKGRWTYTTRLDLTEREGGSDNWVSKTISTTRPVYVFDADGNAARLDLPITYTAHIRMDIQGKPIVLDRDGNGVHLVDINARESETESGARFDWDGDGVANPSGWIQGDGDALLAYDHNGDGRIERADEIAFVDYLDGAATDLEGLRAFDSDADGRLTANDDHWQAFGLWTDNGDAQYQDGEYLSLDDAGIASLALDSDHHEQMIGDNVIHGQASYTTVGGDTGTLADVSFGYYGDSGPDDPSEVSEATGARAPTDALPETAASEHSPDDALSVDGAGRGRDPAEIVEDTGPGGQTKPLPDANPILPVVDEPPLLASDDELDRRVNLAIERAAAAPPTVAVSAVNEHPHATTHHALDPINPHDPLNPHPAIYESDFMVG